MACTFVPQEGQLECLYPVIALLQKWRDVHEFDEAQHPTHPSILKFVVFARDSNSSTAIPDAILTILV